MKKLLIFALFVTSPLAGWSQAGIAELFKMMPDSLMPYLTKNNRLDMIDFMEAKMKAEVTNQLGCKSEMKRLIADTLTIQMSESMLTDLFLISTDEVYDSCMQVICMKKTYLISDEPVQSVASFYTLKWRPLGDLPKYSSAINQSSVLRRDEEVSTKKPFIR